MSMLVEVFWKSGVLLGATLCVNGLLRKKSADVRRLVLSIAVVSLFVTALAWLALPRWTAVTPAWLRLGNPTAIAFAPAEPVIASGGTRIAMPAIRMARPESLSRSKAQASFNRTPDVIPLIWFAGAMLLLARFVNGLHGLRRLRFASEAVSGADLRLGGARIRRVTLLQNDSIAAPVTWGIVRPVILVPAGFEQLPDECRDAALCHELAHIQGYDFLLRGLAEIACALIWFQPLIRVVRRQLREEQELACDNRVLVAGIKASAYARLLLDWDLRPGTDTLIAVGMAHRSCLKRRLFALLDEGQRRGRVARTGILATWFLALTATLSLAAINLAPAIPVQPTVPHPVAEASFDQTTAAFPRVQRGKETRVQLAQAIPARSPAPAPQPADANVRAVSTPLPHFSSLTCLVIVDATVKDPNGQAIDGLSANDFVLTEDGREQMIRTFEFQKVDSATQGVSSYYVLGYYTMNCRAEGTFRKIGITLRGDTQASLNFRGGYFVPNSFNGDFDGNLGAHFTGDGVTGNDPESKTVPPRVIFKVDPEYTEQARKAKYQGAVALLLDIGDTGQVTSVTVIRSLGMGLDETAVDSVTQWKFRPATKNGQPVATQVQVDLGFRLL